MKNLDFGDYCKIEQKRYGADNEIYRYKVVGAGKANYYREVIYNPNYPQANIAELIIRKLRHGKTGTIPLLTQFEYCRFRHTDEEIHVYEEPIKQKGMAWQS